MNGGRSFNRQLNEYLCNWRFRNFSLLQIHGQNSFRCIHRDKRNVFNTNRGGRYALDLK